MKLAFAIHDINKNGGQERSTLEIVNRCANNHEVHVYASTAGGLDPRVRFHRVAVPARRPLFVKDFFFRVAAFFMMRGMNFDVVHCTGTCLFFADIFTVQFCQARWGVERAKLPRHRSFFKRVSRAFQFWTDLFWEKLIFRLNRKSLFTGLSEEVSADLKRFHRLTRVKTIYHGVDISEFGLPNKAARSKIRASLGVDPDETLLLFVGTFERKGLFFLMPAVAALSRRYQIKLCVVGDGDSRAILELARKLKIADRIILTGPRKDVAEFYKAADLFVLPSLYDPFGLVGIEALASGLPCVISRQSGVAELMKNGIEGFILEHPEDSAEIAEKLNCLLENQDALKSMSHAARTAATRQSWDHVWPHYEKIFTEEGERRR